MKGLILNNLYSVEKSLKSSILLVTGLAIVLILTGQPMALRVATFLPFLLIPVNALEVLKHDAISGWQRFEITLPATRQKIIQSKYMTFLLLFMFCMLFISGLFLLVHCVLFPVFSMVFVNFFLRGAGLILCVAALVFPLTYKLGSEKSDTIMMSGTGFSLGMYFAVLFLLQLTIGSPKHFDEIFSVTFLIIAFVLFIISYVVSIQLYKKKEF